MNWFVSLITFWSLSAITLYSLGIYVKKSKMSRVRLVRHENTHWLQQKEMLILGSILSIITMIVFFNTLTWWNFILLLIFPFTFFYIWYFVEWFIRLFTNMKNAYESISFEQEAYGFERDPNYLETRKLFASFKYLLKKFKK